MKNLIACEILKKDHKYIRFGLGKPSGEGLWRDQYVYVFTGENGWKHICYGGDMIQGGIIPANVDTLRKVCREWLKSRKKKYGKIDLTTTF